MNRIELVFELSNPYDYQEFARACLKYDLPPMPWHEYSQKAEVALESRKIYPELGITEGYLQLIKDRKGELVVEQAEQVIAAGPPPDTVKDCGCSSDTGSDEPPTISMMLKLGHVGLAVKKWIAAGAPVLTRERRSQRLKCCAFCTHLSGTRCTLCGCYVRIKSWMGTEDCEIHKWEKE
jgi:hypothetical protein